MHTMNSAEGFGKMPLRHQVCRCAISDTCRAKRRNLVFKPEGDMQTKTGTFHVYCFLMLCSWRIWNIPD